MDEYLDSTGLAGEVDRGGYDLGLSTPPDWVGHTRVVGGGFVDEGMELGFVTNYEIFSRGEDARSVGLIDTLVMTEHGLEVLSNLPMEIMTKGKWDGAAGLLLAESLGSLYTLLTRRVQVESDLQKVRLRSTFLLAQPPLLGAPDADQITFQEWSWIETLGWYGPTL